MPGKARQFPGGILRISDTGMIDHYTKESVDSIFTRTKPLSFSRELKVIINVNKNRFHLCISSSVFLLWPEVPAASALPIVIILLIYDGL